MSAIIPMHTRINSSQSGQRKKEYGAWYHQRPLEKQLHKIPPRDGQLKALLQHEIHNYFDKNGCLFGCFRKFR